MESLLKSILALQNEISYPIVTLHLFAENPPADARSALMINQRNTECVHIKAIDMFLINLVFSETDIELLNNAKLSITGNLAHSLKLKIGGKFMLRWNIDIEECLINGQIGTACHFMSNHQQFLRMYVKLDDLRAGIKASCHCNLGRSNRRVPIERNQLT